jgi:hypothetical protein
MCIVKSSIELVNVKVLLKRISIPLGHIIEINLSCSALGFSEEYTWRHRDLNSLELNVLTGGNVDTQNTIIELDETAKEQHFCSKNWARWNCNEQHFCSEKCKQGIPFLHEIDWHTMSECTRKRWQLTGTCNQKVLIEQRTTFLKRKSTRKCWHSTNKNR